MFRPKPNADDENAERNQGRRDGSDLRDAEDETASDEDHVRAANSRDDRLHTGVQHRLQGRESREGVRGRGQPLRLPVRMSADAQAGDEENCDGHVPHVTG